VNARLLAPALLLAASLLGGCDATAGRQGQQAAAATAVPSPTTLPPDAPIPAAFRGFWVSNLASGGQSHGTWQLSITDHELELLNPNGGDGDWFPLHARAATQDGVSFDADQDCLGASYRWALAGDELEFRVVDRDPCSDRWDTLAGGTWHRAPPVSSFSPSPSPSS
jgi:hypothetical protein